LVESSRVCWSSWEEDTAAILADETIKDDDVREIKEL